MRPSFVIVIACAPALLLACGPAPEPSTPPPASAAPPAPSASTPPLVYSKYTDPLYLAYSDEQNVFGRRTLARLWVAVAKTDPPSEAQKARLQAATRASMNTDRAVAAQDDACEAHVDIALQRAEATKNQLEQRYLQVTERDGEGSQAANQLDAQVHLLRDEVETLRALAAPCPKPMFDQPDGPI